MNKNDEVQIFDIPNWDKYQPMLKQGGNRQRNWVALSTRLLHDPDFFKLTIESRYLWVMLLCYAGAVGVPIKLSASDARVLFKLRRSADFSCLINHGFITPLQTGQTGQDRQDTSAAPSAQAPPKNEAEKPDKKPDKPPSRFAEFWQAYPVKNGKKKSSETWGRRQKFFDGMTDQLLVDIANRMKNDRQWVEGFIPWPQKYLNQELWGNQLTPVKAQNTNTLPADDASLLALAQKLGISTRGKTSFQLREAIKGASV